MQAANLSLNTPVDVREEGGRIIVEPQRIPEFSLGELMERVTSENQHVPVDYGGPLGAEAL